MKPMSLLSTKYASGLFVAGAVALMGAGIATSPAFAAPGAADANSIPVCHLTGSAAHTYVLITPSKESVASSRTLYSNDVYPPFTYTEKNGTVIDVPGQNWDAAGQALYANGCAAPQGSPSPSPTATPVTNPTSSAPASVPAPSDSAPSDPAPSAPPSSAPAPSDPASVPVPSDPAPPSNAPSDPPSSPAASSAAPTEAAQLPDPSSPSSDPGKSPTAAAPAVLPGAGAPSSTDSPSAADPAPSSAAGAAAASTTAAQQVQVQQAAGGEGLVSLRAQTAAGVQAPDFTVSNLFFASGALLLLGAFGPGIRNRRRGRHV
ncbi:hypothetical protein SPF06_18220 [Sinomonas sp. JGH33]|uniref:Gram-positive cocci surface proteins LPxTG domain-containing protein n=1 Tax=Sinomonas terricola TaxID=3110330 RepID=A0ABU5TAG1_9MICC|nr:hypothetical protein [Sinomonas sp. JGH33]MEA5456663.1 hypothetical protein [Sinomonas sp. JGH33]